jgi:di/tricarboxylate transporter
LLEETRLAAGDKVVLEVNDSFFYVSQLEHDFTLTKSIEGYHIQRTDRAMEAAAITLAMVIVVAMGWMSMLNASLLASGAMLLTGCLKLSTVAKCIDWATLVVIACAIGLESAVTDSGLADQIAQLLTSMGGDDPYVALAVIFLGCTFMTNVITNNAAAAFMFPIALSTAAQLSVNFMPFAVIIMVSSSCAFITPTGYQTNLMVWAPGGYAFGDFVKIGTVMTLIVAVTSLVLAPWVFSF